MFHYSIVEEVLMRKKNQLTILKDKIEDIRDKIAEMEGNVEEKISENPIQSVSIAFGAGVISGAIMASMLKRK